MDLSEQYAKRHWRFLEMMSVEGWRIKIYGIAYQGEDPDKRLLEAAKKTAKDHLRRQPLAGLAHGVGFLGVHDGRGANFIFLDRWINENELHHVVYVGDKAQPGELQPAQPDTGSACVWDLFLQGYERQAWLDCVLTNPEGPNLEAYLDRRCNAEV